jgi:integrase
MSPLTLKQKRGQLAWLRAQEHDGTPLAAMSLAMPRAQVIRLRDKLADRPGAADNMVKTISRLYSWAIERDYAATNPAAGCRVRPKHAGATPWTPDDLRRYRERHPPGTMAHLALTLLMFTAARRGDVVRLGKGMERERDGLTWLVWTPAKRGSVETWTPMLPPLWRATRAQTVIGPTYLLTAHGRPFASGDAFGNRLRKWCVQAGLEDRTAHGVRKATAELLSEEGASGAQIAAVLGHTNTRTGEVYTRGAERARMARAAMETMRAMEW